MRAVKNGESILVLMKSREQRAELINPALRKTSQAGFSSELPQQGPALPGMLCGDQISHVGVAPRFSECLAAFAALWAAWADGSALPAPTWTQGSAFPGSRRDKEENPSLLLFLCPALPVPPVTDKNNVNNINHTLAHLPTWISPCSHGTDNRYRYKINIDM